MGLLRGLITLALFSAFVGLVIWLYLLHRGEDFDAAAAMALDEPDRKDHHE